MWRCHPAHRAHVVSIRGDRSRDLDRSGKQRRRHAAPPPQLGHVSPVKWIENARHDDAVCSKMRCERAEKWMQVAQMIQHGEVGGDGRDGPPSLQIFKEPIDVAGYWIDHAFGNLSGAAIAERRDPNRRSLHRLLAGDGHFFKLSPSIPRRHARQSP